MARRRCFWLLVVFQVGHPIASAQAGTFHLGLTGPALTKPQHGDVTFDLLSGVGVGLRVSRHVTIGVTYSGYSIAYHDNYTGPSTSNLDFDETILSAYAYAEYFLDRRATTYVKLGSGRYAISVSDNSNSSIGACLGIGERLYVGRHVSFSFEAQYHFTASGEDDSFPPLDDLFVALLGIELWIDGSGRPEP